MLVVSLSLVDFLLVWMCSGLLSVEWILVEVSLLFFYVRLSLKLLWVWRLEMELFFYVEGSVGRRWILLRWFWRSIL